MCAKRNSKHLGLADLGPCPKKARNQPLHRGLPLGGGLDAETYDRHLEQLSKELGRGIKGCDAAFTLMKETANNRRWITEERPPVKVTGCSRELASARSSHRMLCVKRK